MLRRLLASLLVAALVAGCTVPNGILSGPDPADYVSGKKYPKLVVEIDHPPGYAPTAEALRVLESTLRDVTGKTSIQIKQDASIPVEKDRKYSDAELRSLKQQHQNQKTGGDTAVLYVLYVAGGYQADSGNSRVLGLASPGGSITILKGNIKASSSGGLFGIGGLKEENIERAVLVHEFGHAAGLVSLADGLPDRDDAEHEGHSANKNSVMYWAVETSFGLQELVNGGSSIPHQFDAQDKADLQAIRERG